MSSESDNAQQTKRELAHETEDVSTGQDEQPLKKQRRNRWDTAAPTTTTNVTVEPSSVNTTTVATPVTPTPAPSAQPTNVQAALERARALALKFQTASSNTQPTPAKPVIPTRFDAFGRPLDELGNVMEEEVAQRPTFTLSAQTQPAPESTPAKSKAVMLKEKIQEERERSSLYIDPSLNVGRKKKGMFALVEQGTYSKQAANMRMKRAVILAEQKTQEQVAAIERQDGRLIDWRGDTWGQTGSNVPPVLRNGVEWWDEPVLKTGQHGSVYPSDCEGVASEPVLNYYRQLHAHQLAQRTAQQTPDAPVAMVDGPAEGDWPLSLFAPSAVTSYVHHPRYLTPLNEPTQQKPLELMLTAEERKKARRLRRLEAHQEQQDLIRAGLLPPPEPKVKLGNLARVLGESMVADPTALEAKARKQIEDRRQGHIQMNLDRMLTPEERKEKTKLKYQEDDKSQTQVAVYRCGSLDSNKRKFQVTKNAQKFNLTGLGVMNKACNVVVVEGGPKGLKKYHALITRRIKWNGERGNDEVDEDDEEEEQGEDKTDTSDPNAPGWSPHKNCVLVWQGILPKRMFKNFRLEDSTSKVAAREIMLSQGVGQYWDLAQSHLE